MLAEEVRLIGLEVNQLMERRWKLLARLHWLIWKNLGPFHVVGNNLPLLCRVEISP